MNERPKLANTYLKVEKLSLELKELVDEIASRQKQPDDLLLLERANLTELFVEQRKSEKVTVAELEMQTGIPASTLRRVLREPDKATLQNVLTIARELGVNIWIEK
ncbi:MULTISPECIES: helix-turn-helix domain-containing protein [unclassified Agarivorans]|uniref:helix-turn-helix domain-containing protein n=1 Tax=unclassified Agarivorans TaxID=2636026 RepID=UPI0026E1654A|nr:MULTISPECIES: helix-turn-helix domain-containing protein [unclassified Agarivorans]MDO6686640.1 helix-turn-helix domain-containing protein [Agarivorans sp. 3_MG-2023]MDO6717737.1 helix-turn-helix domain-containing protein [Agarivorans sp. 2_MG-2023]